ncbi:AcrR family transcriptional regulator [Methylobacterium sp. PvP062]|uniref:HTH-type transcriptional repressor ComR n=5 Tax=Pseudomonadota TaxID=1224 RepID=A0ABQ4SPS5_9HYPH|nr:MULTISPECIES: TetR/AcrR family transcriptional regulator [Methylobacterium]MBP2498895.1 AcrR family transcriptional regulator [Methylobacterium sp. PvP105]GAN50988.1 TetR family transcriptional regulator [Methylobacterium sp. ME121]GJE05219.1 HTH-type transcriptional repressor ComR [Methylobacterium jeotgali]MBP2506343.1 AcrR family transcriptional regulator [Methylobacterium sp. PvP109]MDQ0444897.1 AcrR family transcriptional regulator [Methylobacterium persicinum]
MLLFWRYGYEATSLAELTRAMGVTPPSIYVAYGDKKGLFRSAVRR